MNLLIDFTENTQYSVSELQNFEDINEITFIVPVFIFLQNNFNLIYAYVQFLSKRPLIKTNIKPIASQQQLKKMEQYSVVLVRGTFDHLHLGHQIMLLKSIYSTSHKLIIEVKDDQILINKKLKQLIQPLELRKENIRKFIENIKPQIEIKIQTINQVYGTAPYTKGIDAIVMSEQSLHSGKHINKMRKSNGYKKLSLIISPMITSTDMNSSQITKQQRVDGKISSRKIREFLLEENNFTLSQFLAYRQIWDNLVKQINSLCRIKDIDFMVSERWWERIVYKHSKKSCDLSKKIKRNNKEIYTSIVSKDNSSTPNQQSLNEVAISLALMFEGIEEQEKNLNAVVRSFLDNLLKKKGKSKTCKKIRKMILNNIKEFVYRVNPRKIQSTKNVQLNTSLLSDSMARISSNISAQKIQNWKDKQISTVNNDLSLGEINQLTEQKVQAIEHEVQNINNQNDNEQF